MTFPWIRGLPVARGLKSGPGTNTRCASFIGLNAAGYHRGPRGTAGTPGRWRDRIDCVGVGSVVKMLPWQCDTSFAVASRNGALYGSNGTMSYVRPAPGPHEWRHRFPLRSAQTRCTSPPPANRVDPAGDKVSLPAGSRFLRSPLRRSHRAAAIKAAPRRA
jgi:hypothetical protein